MRFASRFVSTFALSLGVSLAAAPALLQTAHAADAPKDVKKMEPRTGKPAAKADVIDVTGLFAGKTCVDKNTTEGVMENLFDYVEAPDPADPTVTMLKTVKNNSFVPFDSQRKDPKKYPKLGMFMTANINKDIQEAQSILASLSSGKAAGFSADRYTFAPTSTNNNPEGCWIPSMEGVGAFLVGGGKVKLTKTTGNLAFDAKKFYEAQLKALSNGSDEQIESSYQKWEFTTARVQWKDEAKGIPAVAVIGEDMVEEIRGVYNTHTEFVFFFDDKGQVTRFVSVMSNPKKTKEEDHNSFRAGYITRTADGKISKYEAVSLTTGKGRDEMDIYNEYNAYFRQDLVVE